MRPKFDKRTFMKIRGCKDPAQMFDFLEKIYIAGFKDGSGTESDPTAYYICGNCGGARFFGGDKSKWIKHSL